MTTPGLWESLVIAVPELALWWRVLAGWCIGWVLGDLLRWLVRRMMGR